MPSEGTRRPTFQKLRALPRTALRNEHQSRSRSRRALLPIEGHDYTALFKCTMLDLVVFSSAVAITRYIGQKNPLPLPPPSSAHFGGGDRDRANRKRHAVVATSSDDAHPPSPISTR
mmetsp:Transcript_45541/g.96835  ORF Transcript_45541/g.96835 Transcript_45541/m.96835 type:complete len:117 (-) Transcript_45541:635-985(-)